MHHLKSSSFPSRSSVLLATAQAKLELNHGQIIDIRVLIDQGSEVSLITERLVQLYNIPRRKSYLSIIGAGAQVTGRSKGSVSLKLMTIYKPENCCVITAEILPKLTSNIPSIKIPEHSWTHLKGVEFADPQFAKPSSVDMILGADVYDQIIQDGLRKGKTGGPIAQLTIFGWILSGPIGQTSLVRTVQGYHCSCEREWYELIERFWRQEEVLEVKPSLSSADQECENHFKTTHTRSDSGRYIVRLPFKSSPIVLGSSKWIALGALNRLFHKFDSNQQFHVDYHQFLTNYEKLGHMEKVPPNAPEPIPVNYLPHHGVISHSEGTP